MVAVVQSHPTAVRLPRGAAAAGTRPGGPGAASELTYRRRRAAAAGIAFAALFVVQSLLSLAGGSLAPERAEAPSASDRFATYVVQPGDTFWSIARSIDPEGDPRPLVDRMVAEHGTAVLRVGERIALPERR